ncbi:MAG: phosphoribosyltransferase [Nitrospira sp.]|nr:phosphoribosyltransferase [Nitrospira sp.]MBH0183575.1 phosphoribosyltransferase [Nitrospira sp.]MBH0185905.1 phosphoribosyltransferase [Nitrospira sp.]MBH0189688.1 phosphoribosyltransferase [Nitrospira sp.]MBH0197365.1 phosphoribosyltransferase [Nitrospira sp.]
MRFKDREEAGRRLVDRLIRFRDDPAAIILALPRGGVAVGYQLSLGLHLPLDVFIARKLGAPDNPEYAIGAVGETGRIYLNHDAVVTSGLSQSDFEALVQVQQGEIARRQALYRQGRYFPTLTDRTVILVDDGIATGSTFFVSTRSIRHFKPRRLIGAVPVSPVETIQEARTQVDELIVLSTPDPFLSVGSHYLDFAQVSDHDVVEYLNLADESLSEWKEQAPSSTVSLVMRRKFA